MHECRARRCGRVQSQSSAVPSPLALSPPVLALLSTMSGRFSTLRNGFKAAAFARHAHSHAQPAQVRPLSPLVPPTTIARRPQRRAPAWTIRALAVAPC